MFRRFPLLESLLLLLNILHGELLGVRSNISPHTQSGDGLTCFLYHQGPLSSVGDVDSNLLVVRYPTDLEFGLECGS